MIEALLEQHVAADGIALVGRGMMATVHTAGVLRAPDSAYTEQSQSIKGERP